MINQREVELRRRLRDDFVFYAKKCLYVRDKEGRIARLRLNKSQLYLHSKLEEQLSQKGMIRALVLKGRQQGVSTYTEARYYWKVTHRRGVRAFILTHEDAATQNLFEMASRYHENCPLIVRPETGTSNAKELTFGKLDSGYKLGTAGTKAVGRSSTVQYFHGSEAAFWPNADSHFAGIMQSIPHAPGTEVILESTANGASGKFYEMWQEAEKNRGEFIAIFMPWFWQSEYAIDSAGFTFTEKERSIAKLYNLTDSQLAWRQIKVQELGEDLFHQEYPCTAQEAFLVSGRPVFDPKSLMDAELECFSPSYRAQVTEDGRVYKHETGSLRVWDDPIPGKRYVIGCLPDGELVRTIQGLKQIEHITMDDTLIDKDGEPVDIVNVQRSFYEGDIISITPALTTRASVFTTEHPILCLADTKMYRPGPMRTRTYKTDTCWKRAEDITDSDILVFPVMYTKELTDSQVLSYFPDQSDIRIDRRVDPACILEPSFWFFMGFWLAEGWLRGGGKHKLKTIEVCGNARTEQVLFSQLASDIETLFNRSATLTQKGSTNSMILKFSCEAVSRFIANTFGQKAANKNVSEWVKYLPKALKRALFDGYRTGDGCLRTDKGRAIINCVSISETLLCDFQDILLSLGFNASVKVLREAGTATFRGRIYATKKTYELNLSARDTAEYLGLSDSFSRAKHKAYGWVEDGFLYTKIKCVGVEAYIGFVNNFETVTHSYCTHRVATHNCDVAEGLIHGDYSCAQVLTVPDGLQVAEWHGHVDPDRFGDILVALGKRYNKAYIGVERNNHGLTTLTSMLHSGYPNMHIQHDIEHRSGSKQTKKLGWLTTGKSKPKIIDRLAAELRDGTHGICSKELIDEMKRYQIGDNGSYNAQDGYHDDRVMARAIAGELISYAPRNRLTETW